MKKLILLFTIACAASQLYGMEPQKMGTFGNLPEDVRNEIFETVFTSGANTLQGTIDLVKVKSALLGISYDNLKTFTALMNVLVNVLAEKFPYVSRKEIAEKFNTPIAKEYVTLGEQLLWPANRMFANRRGERSPVEDIKELLEKDADPNYTGSHVFYQVLESTYLAILKNGKMKGPKYENGVAILKLLLDAGAKPTEYFMPHEQEQVNKGTLPAELRKKLFDLIKQYTEK